jgi:GrpB-like predicted nucleotidyltransferase (UPF0157 family)
VMERGSEPSSESKVWFDGQRWSNADEDRIELSEPDPGWAARFTQEASRIREALGELGDPAIEHVGSTAIPDLPAKPVIDILVLPRMREDWPALAVPLEALGYLLWDANPRTDRMFFVKGMPPYGEKRSHHLHVREATEARDVLLFRDHLLRHPEVAARYGQLKRRLAEEHPTDREAYTDGKAEFIEDVLRDARRTRGPGLS